MTDSELYKDLGRLTKDKDKWEESIPYISSLLSHDSVKIKAKALWMLGEIGLIYPDSVKDTVPSIAAFFEDPEPLLRERSVNAAGRIGRGSFEVIEKYWEAMFASAGDDEAKVRLGFIWASENIAVNKPDLYENRMSVFAELLNDSDDRVRMEAPEMFRVIAKRRPGYAVPFMELLRKRSETDSNRVVRIHCKGAIKAASAGIKYTGK